MTTSRRRGSLSATAIGSGRPWACRRCSSSCRTAGDVDHVAREHLGDRGLEQRGAVLVEQLEQLGGRVAEVAAAFGRSLQEDRGRRGRVSQSVHAAMRSSAPLLIDQLADVPRIFDRFAGVPAAFVRRDDFDAVADAHGLEIGEQLEVALHEHVRHRVVVAIEAHIRPLADHDRHTLDAREAIAGQLHQRAAFVAEDFVRTAGSRATAPSPRTASAVPVDGTDSTAAAP